MESPTTLNRFKHLVFVTTILLIGLESVSGQNLVINPSFEDFNACPQEYCTFQEDVNSWHKPTNGSTDYFNKCGGKMTTGSNFIGQQESIDGDAYAGFYAYSPNGYREYVAGTLSKKLQIGKTYKFSFHISLAEKSQFAINELRILFSRSALTMDTKRNISSPSISERGLKIVELKNPKYFKEKNGWMKVTGEYIAQGDEQHFVIGNFLSNKRTKVSKVASNLKKASYYYIDMVVEDVENSFQLEETYVLENLFFEVDGHRIIDDGKIELQKIVDHLKDNPKLNISIYGHSDNVGFSKYNKELSQRRAKEVGRFLLDNDLTTSRNSWKGFGDMLPVAANSTEEGRKKNRRVEFVISKKEREFYASNFFDDEQ